MTEDTDDRLVRVIVAEIETAFGGHAAHDYVSVWVRDETGLTHSIEFSAETAIAFQKALAAALEVNQRPPYTQ